MQQTWRPSQREREERRPKQKGWLAGGVAPWWGAHLAWQRPWVQFPASHIQAQKDKRLSSRCRALLQSKQILTKFQSSRRRDPWQEAWEIPGGRGTWQDGQSQRVNTHLCVRKSDSCLCPYVCSVETAKSQPASRRDRILQAAQTQSYPGGHGYSSAFGT